MGFRQKSRGIRFGWLEYIAVLLVGLTVAAGMGWWYAATPGATWITVPARVVAVSLVENTRAIEASRPSMQVHFEYLVGGRVYRGTTRFDPVTRILYGALPKEIRELLRTKGYLSFKDLPPNIQEILRKKGVNSFDQVPVRILDALRAQGYHSVQDFPEDVKRLLRSGEYEQAAEAAGFSAETLAALRAASEVREKRMKAGEAADNTRKDSNRASIHASRPARIPGGTILRVRYDAADPAQYEVVRFPWLHAFLSIGTFLGLAAMTLLYCGVIYPRIKQR